MKRIIILEYFSINVDRIKMALFGLSLDMTDVLVRGTYHGLRRVGPHRCGVLSAEWVYNPMPPVSQQIYPPLPLEKVEAFDIM